MQKGILTLLFIVFCYSSTQACSCVYVKESLEKKVAKSYDQSDLIFVGKVIEIEWLYKKKNKPFLNPVSYTFKISKIYKGKVSTEEIKVLSSESSASCGYNFNLGSKYLVYSTKSDYFKSISKNKSDFITSLCSRNKPYNKKVKKETRILRKISKS